MQTPAPARKRGRPAGSPNRPKPIAEQVAILIALLQEQKAQ